MWQSGAPQAFGSFERGLVTRLRLASGTLAQDVPLRRLFVREPVTEVIVEVGHAWPDRAADFRTLLPFPHPVAVRVVRFHGNGGRQDAFLAAALSAPVMASATELTLDAIYPPGLVCWLAKSPFLRGVRRLSLARNGFDCRDAGIFAQNPRLVSVERLSLAVNRIADAGALALARSPHLRNLKHLDMTSNWLTDAGRAALAARFGKALVV